MTLPSVARIAPLVTIFADRFGERINAARVMEFAELERVIRAAPLVTGKDALALLKLARFGEVRTAKNCLRHDANVLEVFGVEGDYDGEKMPIQDAAEALSVAGVAALLYTSPTHTPEHPRWRVIVALSTPLEGSPDQLREQRRHWTGVINAILGGVLKGESFALSQSYYFGRIRGRPEPEIIRLSGVCIDQMEQPPAPVFPITSGKKKSAADSERFSDDGIEADRSADLLARVGKLVREAKADHEIHALQAQHPHVLDQADGKRAIDRAIAKAREGWAREKANRANGSSTTNGASDDIGGKEERIEPEGAPAIAFEDFYAVMPMHAYIYIRNGELWPAPSVNSRLPDVELGLDNDGKPIKLKPNQWLDQTRPVEQLTWAPGEPQIVADRLVSGGGWIERKAVSCFNLYLPPQRKPGDADQADVWIEHVHRVYGNDSAHIIAWLAHRVQRPGEKINHALLLGGAQGIGKDTILEPVKHAVGPWSFSEVSPTQILGRFNGFLKSVILRVSEARDLGEFDRFGFYDHMKAIIAAPPDVLRCDEKNIREHSVFNVTGVIITSNNKSNGVYLPSDDRRHFVAWSALSKGDFTPDYWNRIYRWYAQGGIWHVCAYLESLNLSDFDPKAPPPKSSAFYEIVDANRAPEDAELADLIEILQNPKAITLSMLLQTCNQNISRTGTFGAWLEERRNRRQIPHRLETAGYVPVRNPSAPKDGYWIVSTKRQAVYARAELSAAEQLAAVRALGVP